MPRSGRDARRRLQQAALELFRERGFDQTTTAEIASRAGLNERTYFRHFPDKREVLFDGEAELCESLRQTVAEAPEDLQPLDVLFFAFQKAGKALEANRLFAEPRFEVIAATPALRERELSKHAAMIEAVAEALRHRKVPDRLAELAAQTGWAAYRQAVHTWIHSPEDGLEVHLRQTFEDLRTLSANTQATVGGLEIHP